MSKPRLDWKPITKVAIRAAEELGHTLDTFTGRRSGISPAKCKTAMCVECFGCCWIAYTPSRGFTAGGRLLAYRCGTPEAMGIKAAGS